MSITRSICTILDQDKMPAAIPNASYPMSLHAPCLWKKLSDERVFQGFIGLYSFLAIQGYRFTSRRFFSDSRLTVSWLVSIVKP
jgi:hypothetical protein